MALTADVLRRAVLMAHAADATFVELVGMAELDRGVAFRGGNLRGVVLCGEDLSGFDFSRAIFDGADVRGADFSRAVGLTPDMFRDALFDETTRWPPAMRAAMRNLRGNRRADAFWAPNPPPGWADASGTDDHGRWVTFSIPAADGTRVTQRMRWIPPGAFTIGSPDDEPGRYDDEGPQRPITIAAGYWLFDTPCTQALWMAVMGNNPSSFQSPDRPVEQVSFTDTQLFLREINTKVPGLNLSLPSEALWEYACRAGTTDATYAGPMEILGDNNAPVLDAIAWYGGNSGVDFELDNGLDSSRWSGKQYPHTRAGTHPVARKAPNRWGLYDMLGNVWEWCADAWHGSHDDIPPDGSPRAARDAASRVFRGGCLLDGPRFVRAAFRLRFDPADRFVSLGFRCARVQVSDARGSEQRAGRRKQGERSEPAAADGPQSISKEQQISSKRDQIISALDRTLGTTLRRRGGVYYWNATHDLRVICTISQRYSNRNDVYWFGYRTRWNEFLLARDTTGHLILGCLDLPFAFIIPVREVNELLGRLNTTKTGERVDYWHLRIVEPTSGTFALAIPNSSLFPLDRYRVALE